MNEQCEQYRKATMQFVDKIRTVLANMTKEIQQFTAFET